jgi:hypothetical protein
MGADNYQDLFNSFVSGGGLNRRDEDFDDTGLDYDDTLERQQQQQQQQDGGARKAKATKKVVNEDEVKIVEVDIFTVIQSNVGVTGGTYKSRTPRSAALKAAGAIFKAQPSKKRITFTMQKKTPHSNKRVYAYEANLEIFDEPEIVVKHDKKGNTIEIPITRKITIKKIDVDEDIRREQKESLKAERKALRDKEKAKAKKAEKAEKKPKAEKKTKAEKKPKAEKKTKAEKKVKEDKLIKKADELISRYSASIKQKKPRGKAAANGKGKRNFWGGVCANNSCY